MTNDELRQEFEEWYGSKPEQDKWGNYELPLPQARWEAYQACNAKRQEEMARDKALLRECASYIRGNFASMELKLEKAGYGNE
jgi:hypothetical protein